MSETMTVPQDTPSTEAVQTPQETPPQTPASESTPTETPGPVPTEEPRESRTQRRINQLTRKIHDLERQLGSTATAPAAAPATTDPEPREEDFADYNQFIRASARWTARQEARDEYTRFQSAAAQQSQEALLRQRALAFRPQVEAARAKHPDYDVVVESAVADGVVTPEMATMLYDSTHGAELAYYLSTHPEQALALQEMSPFAATRELIKLEQQVALTQMPQRTVSAAPAPISPLTGNAPVAKNEDDMTTDEWMAHERQKRIERLKTRPFS